MYDPEYSTAEQGTKGAQLDFCHGWIKGCDDEGEIRQELVVSVGASPEFCDAYISELKLLVERAK